MYHFFTVPFNIHEKARKHLCISFVSFPVPFMYIRYPPESPRPPAAGAAASKECTVSIHLTRELKGIMYTCVQIAKKCAMLDS